MSGKQNASKSIVLYYIELKKQNNCGSCAVYQQQYIRPSIHHAQSSVDRLKEPPRRQIIISLHPLFFSHAAVTFAFRLFLSFSSIFSHSVGNFHRSHVAAYMNDLFNTTTTHNSWGIVGTGVMPQEQDKRDLLEQQDWLQTLVELDGNKGTTKASILAPMIDFTPVDFKNERGHQEFYDQLLNDNIKIVSLTVTEGGYFMNNDAKLDLNNEKVQYDIANPTTPRTVFGLVCKALLQRKAEGRSPFTILSCDNIPHNGHVTRDIVLELADQMFGLELKEWIAERGAFPNSMVDRITPAASKEIIDLIQKNYGYQDDAPVLCEPFRQWVLEDDFVNGERPAWETLETVSVVDDVTPYENMKIRILNGGHASL